MQSPVQYHGEDLQTSSSTPSNPASPHLWFFSLCILALLLACIPLTEVARLALQDERYTPILAVPIITIGLIWLDRAAIFRESHLCLRAGLPLLFGGLVLLALSTTTSLLPYPLPAAVFAVVLIWVGGFVACYGTDAAKRALFPLLFLLLTIPIPSGLLDKAVTSLQTGSADVAYRLFKLIGVPIVRENTFTFSLPGLTIEVAEECSGIRSCLALLITGAVIGYLFLRSTWGRIALILLTIPIAIFKNAVRIVTISWLGIYVDSGFLHGNLHRYGGLPFSILALTMLIPFLFLLHTAERGSAKRGAPRCE